MARAEHQPGHLGSAADSGPPTTKPEWRVRLIAGRAAIPTEVRAAHAAALTEAAVRLAAGTGGPVCAYLPIGTEPGSPQLPEALRAAGHEVMLPVVPARPGPLDWARYDSPDDLGPGPIGLREPTGTRLGPSAIAEAKLVLVPALAVDRWGIRIGKGAGYYDRSLPLASPGVPLVVVVYDEELVERLPTDRHDFPTTAALRPTHGVTLLGNTE